MQRPLTLRMLDLGTSVLASTLRGWAGTFPSRQAREVAPRLELFERESCAESRLVREALTMLELDATIRPCPFGAVEHRARLRALAGEARTPALHDRDADRTLVGADAILRHLFSRYGDGRVPVRLRGKLARDTSQLAAMLRGVPGEAKLPGVAPRRPFELYGFEASPRTRQVREVLGAFGHPYVSKIRPLSLGGPVAATPRLFDPNLARCVEGADAIIAHLFEEYGADAKRDVRIDRAADASFPASDPPSFTPR